MTIDSKLREKIYGNGILKKNECFNSRKGKIKLEDKIVVITNLKHNFKLTTFPVHYKIYSFHLST